MFERLRESFALEPNVAALGFSSMIGTFGNSLWMFLLPLYFLSIRASVAEVGLFVTAAAVAASAGLWLGGVLSDRFGRKPVLIGGSLIGTVAVFALAATSLLGAAAGAYALSNLGGGIAGPPRQALLAESVREEKRATAVGTWMTVAGIPSVFGPAIGGAVWSAASFRWLFLAGATLTLTMSLIRIIWVRETFSPVGRGAPGSAVRRVGVASLLRDDRTLQLLLGVGVVNAAFASMASFLVPVYSSIVLGLSRSEVGLLFSVYALAFVVTPVLGGKLSERAGLRATVVSAGLAALVPELLFLFSPTAVAAFVTFGLWAGLDGMGSPAFQAWMLNRSPAEVRGRVQGTYFATAGLAAIPFPALGGVLYSSMPKVPFFADIAASLAIFVALATVRPGPRGSGTLPDRA